VQAAVGTQSYTEDVVRSFRTLKKAHRSSITVMHGFPLLISGLSNANIIKELLETCNWHNAVISNGAKDISRTRKLFMDSLLTTHSNISNTSSDTTSSSSSRPDYSANNAARPLMLPESLTEYDKKRFETKGFGSQVRLCLPITEKDEIKLFTSLLTELNKVAGLDLSTEYSSGRSLYEEQEERMPDFGEKPKAVTIGGSLSCRLLDDFDQDECQVTDLYTPGWKITESNVHAKTKELEEELAGYDENTTTVVFQLMDNSSYWVIKGAQA